MRDPHCTDCALHATAEFVCLLGQGPASCDAMIIGEAPGRREDDSGKPFVGRAGQLLDEVLADVDLSRKDVYITNAVHCRPPGNRTPKKREIDACRRWLDYEIAKVKPKYILLMGNVPLLATLGLKGVKKLRGRPIDKDGVIYLPTYHPSYILRSEDTDRSMRKWLEEDLRKFKAIIDFGGIPEERAVRPHVVTTEEQAAEMLKALVGVVSCDIETTCLYPWAREAKIVTIGVGTASGEFSVFLDRGPQLRDIVKRMADALSDCVTVFQNGKFDILWILEHTGVRLRNDFDTMLAHYLIDENSPHGLEFLAQLYFGAPDWDIPLEEKQGKAPAAHIAKYHSHDLYYTRKLYFKLKRLLDEDPQVKKVFDKVLMPAANLFVDIEHTGCYVDTDKMEEAEKYLRTEMAAAERRLNKWGHINWASPKQVGELLYDKLKIKCPMKTNKGAPSTAESALKMIRHPAVKDLLTFRGHKQQLSFFIEGWKPYIVNNRIHPSFKLHGTVTGRLSCEHPNFQQVPRDTRIRSLITAPPGWTFLEADLSQIELRIVAELAEEPSMLQAFRNGIDIHWLTAMREIERGAGLKNLVLSTAHTLGQRKVNYADAIQVLLQAGADAAAEVDKSWKEYRKKAKAVNFGYVFGMWWKKFKQYARDNYEIELTDAEAEESRTAFFQMYRLEQWHERQRRFARSNGYVRSLSGRKRRLPDAKSQHDTPQRGEALRQAINAPVQSFANELNLMTLIQLCKEYPRSVVRPVMTVHDQIGAEVKNEHVPRVVTRLEEIMRGPQLLEDFDISLKVPICGEVKLGPWGSGTSLNKWKDSCSKSLNRR